jgi:hypothetical protein
MASLHRPGLFFVCLLVGYNGLVAYQHMVNRNTNRAGVPFSFDSAAGILYLILPLVVACAFAGLCVKYPRWQLALFAATLVAFASYPGLFAKGAYAMMGLTQARPPPNGAVFDRVEEEAIRGPDGRIERIRVSSRATYGSDAAASPTVELSGDFYNRGSGAADRSMSAGELRVTPAVAAGAPLRSGVSYRMELDFHRDPKGAPAVFDAAEKARYWILINSASPPAAALYWTRAAFATAELSAEGNR